MNYILSYLTPIVKTKKREPRPRFTTGAPASSLFHRAAFFFPTPGLLCHQPSSFESLLRVVGTVPQVLLSVYACILCYLSLLVKSFLLIKWLSVRFY